MSTVSPELPLRGTEVSRPTVEDFLFEEAAILDSWRLDDWLALFQEGATFQIPTTDWKGHEADRAQFFISDDWDLIKARVKRLKSRKAHAENPRSRTHRVISNVRITERETDRIRVHASFIAHRLRDGVTDSYLGWYDHLLACTDQGLRFQRRRTVLAHERLWPGGRLGFIL